MVWQTFSEGNILMFWKGNDLFFQFIYSLIYFIIHHELDESKIQLLKAYRNVIKE